MKRIKKSAILMLSIMSLLSILCMSAQAQKIISVSNETALPGAKATFDIAVSDSSAIAGMNFTITYDSQIIKNPVIAKGTLIPADFVFDSNKVEGKDELRFLFYKDPTGQITQGGGTIASITFDVSASANGGQTSAVAVNVSESGVSDASGVSTTGNFTFQNGTFTVAGPNMPITENFDSTNGWVYWSPAPGSNIDAPNSYSPAGYIGFEMKPTAKKVNFAFWYKNPSFQISEDSLYKATFRLESDIPKPAEGAEDTFPWVRLRTAALSSQLYDIYEIEGIGNGAFRPDATGATYNSYFVPPQGRTGDQLFLALDAVKTNKNDATSGKISMDQISITRQSLSSVGPWTPVKEYTFEASAENWTNSDRLFGVDPYMLNDPIFNSSSGKLTITGDDYNNFGYWTSPVSISEPEVILEANKLYKITALVSTDVTDITKVPTFRIRVMANNYQSRYIQVVNSEADPENNSAPTSAGREYTIYLTAEGSQANQACSFAFDFLNLKNSGDELYGSISLENLKIEKADIPNMLF